MRTGLVACLLWVGCARTPDPLVAADAGALTPSDAAAECPVEGPPVEIGEGTPTGLDLDFDDGEARPGWHGEAWIASGEGDVPRLVGDGLDLRLRVPEAARRWLPPGQTVHLDFDVAQDELAFSTAFAIAIRLRADGPPVLLGLHGEGRAVLGLAPGAFGAMDVELGDAICPAHPSTCWARVQDRLVRVTVRDASADVAPGGAADLADGDEHYQVLLGASTWGEGTNPGVSCADEPLTWLDLAVVREPRDHGMLCADCGECQCQDRTFFGAGACFYDEADPAGLCRVDFRPDGIDYETVDGCAAACAAHGGPDSGG